MKNLQKIKIQKINQNNTFRIILNGNEIEGETKTIFFNRKPSHQACKHMDKQTNKQTNKQLNKQTN